jgi:hypothetical protein
VARVRPAFIQGEAEVKLNDLPRLTGLTEDATELCIAELERHGNRPGLEQQVHAPAVRRPHQAAGETIYDRLIE